MYVVGFVGSFSVQDILCRKDLWNEFPDSKLGLKTHLVRNVVPRLKGALNEGKSLTIKDGVASMFESVIMVAFLGEACYIQSNFSVIEVQDYDAVGSGRLCANASMYASGQLGILTEKRARLAVEAACEYVPSVGGKVNIMQSAIGLEPKPKKRKK